MRSFRYPIQPAPPCAVIGIALRGTAEVRALPALSLSELRGLADTTAIAAPVAVLRKLAAERCELRYPIVAFTGEGYGVLTEEDRDMVWRAFGVPVYEQLLGPDNELLAEECDAHDGLHVCRESPRGVRLPESLCACGRRGVKLADLSCEASATA